MVNDHEFSTGLPVDGDEFSALVLRYLDRGTTSEEDSILKDWLTQSPQHRDLFVLLARQTGDLTEIVKSERARILEETVAPVAERPAESKPGTRRSSLRRHAAIRRSSWMPAFVAAGVLFGLILLVLSPLEKDPAASQKAKETPASASKELEVRRQANRERLERERAGAESEAKRRDGDAHARQLEAEVQLREIEEKRRLLTQAKPETVQDPQAKAQRDKDLEGLKRDQERIEQELREAAELAKKTAQPTPAQSSPGTKPISPSATPADSSPGATQAALAMVEEISGEAFVLTKDGKSPVTVGANLLPGQGLETRGGASRIVLRFPDRTRVDLGPGTTIGEIKTDSGKQLTLAQGTVRAVVAKQPKEQPLILLTPHGQAKVVGTTLRLYVDPNAKKETKLEVEEGKVELKNLAGMTVYVESGHYAVAAVGVELVQHVLPPRPRPTAWVQRNPQETWAAILQNVSLVPGRTYTLSVWIQTSAPFPGGRIGARSESGAILAQQPFGASEPYARTILVFKAGPNPTAVIFAGFENPTNAGVWMHVDDWSLVEKGGNGTNLIQDPDFEGQNALGHGLSGPWSTEGKVSGDWSMGLDPFHGRIPAKGSSQGEQK